jgi:hypothetical protein
MMMRSFIVLCALVFAVTSCGGGSGSGMGSVPRAGSGATRTVDTDLSPEPPDRDDGVAILSRLPTIATIGSTVDPTNGDLNPYGLDVAKTDAGLLHAGDLVVCNFNDSANVQGNGTTIVALAPHPGAQTRHIAQDASLKGCDALAINPNDNIWAAAFVANDNPIVSPGGTIRTTLSNGPWHGPFGEAFSPTAGPFGRAAFYVSNAGDGSIVRVNIGANGISGFDVIATGFAVNGGAPGSILGPSGLQYDAAHDRLYIVDGADNSLWAFKHVSTIPAGGIAIGGEHASGPFAERARRVFSGAPLNGPISSALLPNGHLVLGNTLDPNGTNLMVEIAPSSGRVVAQKNVDEGPAAALFGIVATGTTDENARIYFNDDNDNTLKALTP